MGKHERECTIITMVNSVLVITIKLTSCSFDTHMFSSKHDLIRMTLVKYSYETAEKHEIDAAPLCSNMHKHAKTYEYDAWFVCVYTA